MCVEMKKSQKLHQKSEIDLPGPLRSPKWTSSWVIALKFYVEFDGRTPRPSNHQQIFKNMIFPKLIIVIFFIFSHISYFSSVHKVSPPRGLTLWRAYFVDSLVCYLYAILLLSTAELSSCQAMPWWSPWLHENE